jgi:hypothetical protein
MTTDGGAGQPRRARVELPPGAKGQFFAVVTPSGEWQVRGRGDLTRVIAVCPGEAVEAATWALRIAGALNMAMQAEDEVIDE